jgi:hypothetical protein
VVSPSKSVSGWLAPYMPGPPGSHPAPNPPPSAFDMFYQPAGAPGPGGVGGLHAPLGPTPTYVFLGDINEVTGASGQSNGSVPITAAPPYLHCRWIVRNAP